MLKMVHSKDAGWFGFAVRRVNDFLPRESPVSKSCIPFLCLLIVYFSLCLVSCLLLVSAYGRYYCRVYLLRLLCGKLQDRLSSFFNVLTTFLPQVVDSSDKKQSNKTTRRSQRVNFWLAVLVKYFLAARAGQGGWLPELTAPLLGVCSACCCLFFSLSYSRSTLPLVYFVFCLRYFFSCFERFIGVKFSLEEVF